MYVTLPEKLTEDNGKTTMNDDVSPIKIGMFQLVMLVFGGGKCPMQDFFSRRKGFLENDFFGNRDF